jgi:hypothetical protein
MGGVELGAGNSIRLKINGMRCFKPTYSMSKVASMRCNWCGEAFAATV